MENNTDQQLRLTKKEKDALWQAAKDIINSYDNIGLIGVESHLRDFYIKTKKANSLLSRRDLTIVSLTDTVNKLEAEVAELKGKLKQAEINLRPLDKWQNDGSCF